MFLLMGTHSGAAGCIVINYLFSCSSLTYELTGLLLHMHRYMVVGLGVSRTSRVLFSSPSSIATFVSHFSKDGDLM